MTQAQAQSSSESIGPPPFALDERPRTLILGFYRRYVRRYLPIYALGLVCLAATNALTIAIPGMIKDVFDELAKTAPDVTVIYHFARLIAAAAVGVIVVRTLSRVLFFNPGRTIEFRLRNDMLARLLSLTPERLSRHNIGDLVSRAGNDANFVRALVGFSLLSLFNIIFAASMALSQMLATDVALTLYCFVPLVLAVLVLRAGIRSLFSRMLEAQEQLGSLSDHILESFNGISVIQAAAAEPVFIERFDRQNRNYNRLHIETALVRCFLLPSVSLGGGLAIFILLFAGGQRALEGQLTIGDMAAYVSYVGVLVGALASGGWVIGTLQRGYISLRRCGEVLALQSIEPTGTTPLPANAEGVRVEVRDLQWRYGETSPATSTPAETAAGGGINGVSFVVPAGGVLGIYGPVGSGKSTLVQLIARVLLPPPGTVLLDGIDILDIDRDALRRAVAVVPQDAFLFSRSLRDNVGFIDPPERIVDERVVEAIQKAQLAREVARFTDGVQTVVGERGLTLSGGQRQRAQLARALYRPFRLLILDDVLSAVDHDTEELLLEAIASEVVGSERSHSAILVSNRVSALAWCDEILVLGEGAIAERGRHAQLVGANGVYSRAWRAWQDEEAEQKTERSDSSVAAAPT